MLQENELERYARHIVLPEIGGPGQQKLKNARVLVIGAGGLGAPLIAYLCAAGVGKLGIVDHDRVSLANLQRQIIHDTGRVGDLKAASAAAAAARINPHVAIEQWPIRLSAANALALVSLYDIVADGSDNFETRRIVAERCEEAQVPLVTAMVGRFDGSITTFKPFARDGAGNLLPRYRDLFPAPPPEGSIPTCAEAGVLGALTGVMGSMQALEVIKEITGMGEGLAGRLLLYDSKSARFDTIGYKRGKG